ncbi:hypothetical protein [Streptomyces sp. NBC_01445]|uniref:hypothetical protein n=1 Tax=Streptomyces sp. NBC_01445 TaxID=2903869 RepID=UPI002DDB524C|nr:hypothetical protein [Streptomyces sp. NBC_01445]WSE02261.1 hypothetical protein OG574_01855 [Streptomyces sp. NBC_01445]
MKQRETPREAYEEIAEHLGIDVGGAKGTGSRMMMCLAALNAPHAVLLGVQAGLLEGRVKKRDQGLPGNRRLGVTDLSRGQRRAAAVGEARRRGLISNQPQRDAV